MEQYLGLSNLVKVAMALLNSTQPLRNEEGVTVTRFW